MFFADRKMQSLRCMGIILAASAVAALALLFIARSIWLMDRGFDLTDESFYLMMSKEPGSYDLFYGLFGYGLHPLFELSGGSIAWMRRIGAMMLVGAGVVVGAIITSGVQKTIWGALLIVAAAFTSMMYYHLWIPMPSYNWLLAIAGYVLFVSILLLRHEQNLLRSAFAASVAAVLVALTRPQNALAFGAIYTLALCLAVSGWRHKVNQALRVLGFIVVLMVPCLLLLPVKTILEQIRVYTSIFGMSHPIQFSLLQQQLEFVSSSWYYFLSIALFAAAFVLRSMGYVHLRMVFAIAASALMVIALLVAGHSIRSLAVGPLPGTIAWCLLAICCYEESADPRLVLLLAISGLIPWAATVGGAASVGNQLMFFSGISLFVVVVATSLVARRSGFVTLSAVCAAFLLSYWSVRAGLARPYRLADSIAMQSHPVVIGGHELLVDARTRDFVDTLQRDARLGGFCRGGDAIDLSGSIPGAVLLIGGRTPVFPWLFTGYPFSQHLARSYLALLGPERLAHAWLLMSRTQNSFTLEEWRALGVNFENYRLVDVTSHPVDSTEVSIFAPRDSERSCAQVNPT